MQNKIILLLEKRRRKTNNIDTEIVSRKGETLDATNHAN